MILAGERYAPSSTRSWRHCLALSRAALFSVTWKTHPGRGGARLGWAVTTVKGRLQKGREVLRAQACPEGLDLAALLGATPGRGSRSLHRFNACSWRRTLRAVFPARVETANSAALNLVQGILQLHAWRRFSLLQLCSCWQQPS